MILYSCASETSAYKKIDTQIENRFEETKDNYRRSCLISAVPWEESETPSKPAGYTVVQHSTDVDFEEHAKHSVKPHDVISYFQSPYVFGNKEGFRRSEINEIGMNMIAIRS